MLFFIQVTFQEIGMSARWPAIPKGRLLKIAAHQLLFILIREAKSVELLDLQIVEHKYYDAQITAL
jgi:hypothetical protein